jgi:hypothetical protein
MPRFLEEDDYPGRRRGMRIPSPPVYRYQKVHPMVLEKKLYEGKF